MDGSWPTSAGSGDGGLREVGDHVNATAWCQQCCDACNCSAGSTAGGRTRFQRRQTRTPREFDLLFRNYSEQREMRRIALGEAPFSSS